MTTDPYPTVDVQVSFTPAKAPPVWTSLAGKTDLSAELTCGGGRQYELDVIEPGAASLPFDNSDGSLTGGNSGSPFAPYVKPQRRCRVLLNGTDVWHGRVQGWPTAWPGGSSLYSMASVAAADLTARLKRDKLRSAYAEEVALDGPIAWWPLDDPAGSAGANEATGNYVAAPLQIAIDQNGKTTATAVFGASGITPYDSGSALAFGAPTSRPPAGGYPYWLPTLVNSVGPVLQQATGFTIEAIVQVPPDGTPIMYAGQPIGQSTVYAQGRNQSTTPDVELGILWEVATLLSGATALEATPYAIIGGSLVQAPSTFMTPNSAHLLQVSLSPSGVSYLHLDGVCVAVYSGLPAVPANPDWAGIGARGARGYAAAGTNQQTWFYGSLQHVALYNHVFTTAAPIPTGREAARIFALQGNTGELADNRIQRILGYTSWPATDVAPAAGIDLLGPYNQDGVDPWVATQTAAADDGGVAFLGNNGYIRSISRRDPRAHNTVAPVMILDCNNQDVAADLSFSLDDIHVATIVEVSSPIAKVIVYDTSGQRDDYGDLTITKSLNLIYLNALAQAANAILARVSTPQPRGGTVTIALLGQSVAVRNAAIALTLGDRIRLINLPAQAPNPTMDFIVEARTHALQRSASGHWQLKLEVSPLPAQYVVEGSVCDTGLVAAW